MEITIYENIETDDVLDNTENFVEIELKSDPHVKSSHNLS